MNTSHALTYLGARVKLFKRHVFEQITLLANQKEVRRLAQESLSHKLTCQDAPKMSVVNLTNLQAAKLNELMMRQNEERQELKLRHQQEINTLEHVLKKPFKRSN